MTQSSGLAVKKPVSVWNKPLKFNFKDFFKALGNAGIDAATGQWIGLGKDAVDVLVSIGLEIDEPSGLAWALIFNSLTTAIEHIVVDSQLLIQDVPTDIDELINSLDFSLESSELEISASFFEHPEQLSIIEEIQIPLRQWLEGFGIEPFQAEQLSNRLPAYFVFALNREWQRHSPDYTRIKTQVETPFTQASEREQGWRLYNSWLQKQIQEPMLFEAFGLDDIYVDLRAYFRRKREGSGDGDDEFAARSAHGDREQYERVVVDLKENLQAWLQTANKNDAIRIISGGPGSGKSSFAKIFAADHAGMGKFPVLFVPLHQFNLSGDLVKAVGEFVRYDQYLKENPLDPDNSNLRLLIIFDGLDELAMQGKLAKEAAQEFVKEVQLKVKLFNQQETRLQVLITGREVAVQESFKDPQQILHVLPYFVPEENRKKEADEPYVDSANRLADDQRNVWWQKYGRATQKPYSAMPEELNQGNLTEITAQPLLNYLVALSYMQGKLTLSEQTNLNTVYADLLDAVYDRSYEGENRRHIAIGDMSREQFVRVLEEIALAAWHGDGRTTTVEEIERHCNNSGLQPLLEIFEQGAKAGVTRLLAAFYFRQSGVRGSERTFEFTHKSFGEYLTARRIVREMERIQRKLDRRKEDMEEGWDEKEALKHWAEICGPTRMDTYLLRFLRDEVALKKPPERVKQWQQTFAHLIGIMLRQGMPMEQIKLSFGENEISLRFQQANQWAVNAEESLLAALGTCAEVTQKLSYVDWPSVDAFGAWIARLQGQRVSSENVVALKSLSYLDLGLMRLDLRDFYAADLYGASFIATSLYGTCLEGANLVEANLAGARLDRARLYGASLDGANLHGANLVEANLDGADLIEANLSETRLNRASLKGASLLSTSLDKANLNEANFAGTDLQDISWDEETSWDGVIGLEEARNVPEALKQQLGLA